MRSLAEHGFSTAIFGPAWAHEHFSTSADGTYGGAENSIAKAVDRSMWKGVLLPKELGCDCRKGRPHHNQYYTLEPIVKSACEYPAGSNSFLETDFGQAFAPNIEQGVDVCNSFYFHMGNRIK